MTPAAISAGDLRERVGFYSRVSLDDGYGNTQAGYDSIPEFILSANIKPRLGGEPDIVPIVGRAKAERADPLGSGSAHGYELRQYHGSLFIIISSSRY